MPALSSSSTESGKQREIDKDEQALYDRQIRLWGLEAQNRLRNSSVLLVGMGGLGAEIAKNLMLSGLKALTIMDGNKVTQADLSSQFLVTHEQLGGNLAEASKHRTQVLNPMVELHVLTEDLDESKPEEFFKQFDLVILADQKYSLINHVNKICRKNNIRFQAGGVFGWNGYAFFDFNDHFFLLPKPKVYVTEQIDDEENNGGTAGSAKKTNGAEMTTVTIDEEEDQKIRQTVSFPSFEASLNFAWPVGKKSRRMRMLVPPSYFPIAAMLRLSNKHDEQGLSHDELVKQWTVELKAANMEESAQNIVAGDLRFMLGPKLCPACAIVGSLIGQEAIKALSQNDVPLKNFFVYSALDTTGIVVDLPPKA